jgi:hypothetical protein
MNLLDKLDRKLGKFAVSNVTVYLIAGQSLFYVMYMMGKAERSLTTLSAGALLAGEWWRLVVFPFDPPRMGPFFVLFAWYLFYMMGSALEEHWGSFRYNLFLLTGYLLTLAAAFLAPFSPVSNAFIGGSVFLAFAFLFPEFELLLFFVLPVRIKWLALFTWLGYAYQLIVGDGVTRLMVLASTGNFLLFFARDILVEMKYGKKRVVRRVGSMVRQEPESFHRCTVCGITDKTHPHEDFRYCPQCDGQHGYCQAHIFAHEHVKKG